MEDNGQDIQGKLESEEIINPVSVESKQEEVITNDLPRDEKNPISKKKKIVIISSIIVLIIVVSIGGFSYWRVTTTQKNLESYKQTLATAQTLILTGAIADLGICDIYSTVWRDAIDSRYKDFNTEISKEKSKLQSDGILTKSNKLKDDLDESMKKINNPPQKYQKVYDKVLEMYGIYSKIHSQANSPSGSLVTFNQNINTLQEDILKAGNELKVIMPSN